MFKIFCGWFGYKSRSASCDSQFAESSDADDILPMDVLNHVNIYETLRGGDITISLKECFANIVESELDNYNMPYQYQRSNTQPTQ